MSQDTLKIHWQDADEYEEARVGRVFNKRRPNRFPAGVLNAQSVSDVVEGVKLAAEKQLKVAVRSGGHSWAVWSVRDNSLLIDLGQLRELQYDPETTIVTASPSITGGELNSYLATFGRFFAGGHCPTVGIGGFLLQGGQGWGARGWGWSCEQIQSMDVVLPSGELVTASETENADLFWAARGSGPGFFGVVVRFRLKTRPAPKAMHHTTYIIPAGNGNFKEIITWFQGACPKMDERVEAVCLAFTRERLFPGQPVEDPVKNPPLECLLVIRATAIVDTKEHAASALEIMAECPKLDEAIVKIVLAPTSLAEEYAQQMADNPDDARYWSDNAWMVGSPEDIADTLDPLFTTLPSKHSFVLYYSMAPLRPLPDMAFDIQTEHYVAGYIISRGEDRAEEERCAKWLKERYAAIDDKRGLSGGAIGMYLGDSDLATRPAQIMSDEHWKRWCSIRDKYDPSSLFVGFLASETHRMNTPSWEK